MYGTLALSHRALDDLADSAGHEAIDELRRLARPIEGLRVLNLSVTGFGTGTAELLSSSVPLLTDLGIDCHWQVVRASEDVTMVTRQMYRALGGHNVPWTQEMTDTWLAYAQMNADLLTEPFDVIIMHDAQPAAMRSFVKGAGGAAATKWIMHSHLDLSSAQDDVWMQLRSHIEKYDAAIFESPAFTRSDITIPTYIVPPAIDPNSARNMPLPGDVVRTVLERYGIDPKRPIVCQVSPCDAASDHTGAFVACQSLREEFPDLQFVILLTTEPHDPSGRACYDELARLSLDEDWMFVLSTGSELGNVEMNVFQRAADVVIQKGLRKGFGLWVADAIWKERPVVVAPAPGLQEQVVDGESGIIAHTPEDFAEGIATLLRDPELAARYGKQGRQHIAERFLITRYLKDYVQILDEVHRS